MSENWAKYGYPDEIKFRTIYLPTVGLIKALNERRAVVDLEEMEVPLYFSPYPGSQWFIGGFDSKLQQAAVLFVNPEKISSAQNYQDCFWVWDDLMQAAAGGEEFLEAPFPALMPEFPVKWAMQRYNAINLLRYVPTSEPQDFPVFTYEDKNNTFDFKA